MKLLVDTIALFIGLALVFILFAMPY